MAFGLAVLAPTMGFCGYVLWQQAQTERALLLREKLGSARTLASVLDSDLHQLAATLWELSASPRLRAGDYEGFRDEATRRVSRTGAQVILVDEFGRPLAATRGNWQPASLDLERATREPSAPTNSDGGTNLLATRAFGAAFEPDDADSQDSGTSQTGAIGIGIKLASEAGKAAHVLFGLLGSERIAAVSSLEEGANGRTFALIDADGRMPVIAGTAWRDAAAMRRAAAGAPAGGSIVEVAGDYFAVYRSPVTGWTTVVGSAAGWAGHPFVRPVAQLLAGGVVLVGLALALALVFAERIARPMRRLAQAAAELGRGKDASLAALQLREADAVARELAAAAGRIAMRDRALRMSEERYRGLAKALPALVWLIRDDGTTLFCSEGVAAYAGGTLDPTQEGRLALVHPLDADRMLLAPSPAAGPGGSQSAGDQVREGEIRLRRHDGEYRWHQVRVLRVEPYGEYGFAWIAVATDVDDLKRAQVVRDRDNAVLEERFGQATQALEREASERRNTVDHLRKVQKMEAVSRLAAGIAHSFNNKLTVISGNLDSVVRRFRDHPAETKRLVSAMVAVDQASNLISKLLAFARSGNLNPQVLSVAARLSSLGDLLDRSLLGDAIEIRLDFPTRLWPVEVDPEELDTAIVNLAANARDAMPQGGILTISARNVNGRHGDPLGDHVEIAVSDTGPGISPEDIHRVFEPFYTTKEPDRATGLGLAQVQNFVGNSGGLVEVVSRPGEGASILLRLPRASMVDQLSPHPPRHDLEDRPEQAPGRGKILVVDDEPDVAHALQGMLEQLGYSVAVAIGGQEAHRALRAGRHDLVLSDVTMPGGIDGVTLARELRDLYPGLPVILITGNPRALGGSQDVPILLKPITSARLDEAVREMLREQKPDSGNVVAFSHRRPAP